MRLTGPVVLLELPVERLAELLELVLELELRVAVEPEVERDAELLVVERAGAEELEVLRETLEPELVVVLAAPLLLTRLFTVVPLVERLAELLELELVLRFAELLELVVVLRLAVLPEVVPAVLRFAELLELVVAVLRLAELFEVVAVLRLAELLVAEPVLRLALVVAVERLAELLLALDPVLVEVALWTPVLLAPSSVVVTLVDAC